MRWAGNAACNGERKGINRGAKGKRPLGRPRRRWEDIIKMDLQEAG